jgi:tetratricopeptide (TPR) repeat protein
MLGRITDGIMILEDLAMMSQNAFDITIKLAQAYLDCEEYHKALDKYIILLDKATPKEAKQINAYIGDLYIQWSLPAANAKDYPKATELLDLATQYSPVNPEIYYHFAYNHFEQKNYTSVVEFITKAMNYDKDNLYIVKNLLLLSQAQHELGNFFEEKKALSDLLNIDPKNAEGLYRLGLMYVAHHDVKNAEESFEKAITYEPDLIQAKYNLAILCEGNNRDRAKELAVFTDFHRNRYGHFFELRCHQFGFVCSHSLFAGLGTSLSLGHIHILGIGQHSCLTRQKEVTAVTFRNLYNITFFT